MKHSSYLHGYLTAETLLVRLACIYTMSKNAPPSGYDGSSNLNQFSNILLSPGSAATYFRCCW